MPTKLYEDKQKICDALLEALKLTREAGDAVGIDYDNEAEIVTVTFEGGGNRRINVGMDSGTAMIRDIMNHLGC